MRRRVIVLLLAVAATGALGATPALALDARLAEIGSFSSPIYVTSPPADTSRLFVVERAGTIQVLGGGTKRTFLNLVGKVSTDGERGLLSMAFAPDYATSGRFYVYYTMVNDPSTSADENGDIRIAEYKRSASNPDAADASSARPLLTIEHSRFNNHDGGQLEFGPDGFLYAGTGDGGLAGDPFKNGQNTTTLLGKILRIDPRKGSPFAIPAGNLSPTSPVFDYGLRNPFRFSFDRQTGALVIGDVGQGAREEIDVRAKGAPGGANFGWSKCEGNIAYPPTSSTSPAPCVPPPGYVAPVLDYSHAGGACAIIGGYVVRDSSIAALNGRYVYTDLCTGVLRSVDLAKPSGDRAVQTDVTFGSNQIVSFGQDARGCVYVVSQTGKVYRFQSPTGASPCPGGAPGTGLSLGTSGQRRQPVLSRKAIRVGVRCNNACIVHAHTAITFGGSKRRLRLAGVTKVVGAGSKTVVVILVSKKARKVLARRLRGGRTALATVTVSAQDIGGGVQRATRRVRLVG
jgi:glucose/arabinose dehydrogenase